MTSPNEGKPLPHAALRAALYLRVSTARQAEHDVSIPTRSGRVKPIARRAACNWWKPLWNQAHRRPTTAALSSSA